MKRAKCALVATCDVTSLEAIVSEPSQAQADR